MTCFGPVDDGLRHVIENGGVVFPGSCRREHFDDDPQGGVLTVPLVVHPELHQEQRGVGGETTLFVGQPGLVADLVGWPIRTTPRCMRFLDESALGEFAGLLQVERRFCVQAAPMSGLLAARRSPSTTIWPGFDSLFFGGAPRGQTGRQVVLWFGSPLGADAILRARRRTQATVSAATGVGRGG